MRPTPHRLLADFPQLAERIHALLRNDAHFARLNEEYEALDERIHGAETGTGFLGDEEMEPLKKKRARLKDQLYARLKG